MIHPDPAVEAATVHFLDAVCEWERATGRQSFLVFVPSEPDEPLVVADSGKPLPDGFEGDALHDELLVGRIRRALENYRAAQANQ